MPQQWSRAPGVRIGWHAVESIYVRPEQPNPNLVYALCGVRFPETQTADTVPDGDPQCPRCLAKVGG